MRQQRSGARVRHLQVAAFAAALLVAPVSHAQDFRWISPLGGNWSLPGNWFAGDVPGNHPARPVYVDYNPYAIGAGTNVYSITSPISISQVFLRGTLQVNAAVTFNTAGSVIQGELVIGNVSGAGLNSLGGFQVTGPLTIFSGSLSGPGNLTAGSLVLTSPASKTLVRTLTAAGGEWQQGTVFTANGTFNNTGLFVVSAADSWRDGHFNNSGTLRKDGAGIATMGQSWSGGPISFNNTGLVLAANGGFDLVAPGTHTGAFEGTGGLVRLRTATHNLGNGAELRGGVQLFDATINLTGAATVAGAGPEFVGGVMAGSGSISGGQWTWPVGPRTIQGSWTNAATAIWTAGLVTAVNSSITNSGVLDVRTDADYRDGVLTNTGLVIKSAGAGVARLATSWNGGTRAVNNTGSIRSTSGRLNVHGSGSFAGDWRGTGGGTVAFADGTPTLTGGNTATGDVRIDGATLQSGPAATLWNGPLHTYSGGFVGPSDVTITGASDFAGGGWSGAGLATFTGGVRFLGGSIGLSRRMIFQGPSTWSGGTIFGVNSDLTFAGSLAITGDNDQRDAIVRNLGTITKTAGAGTSGFGVPWNGGPTAFHNSGSISALTGVISINTGGTHAGSFGTTGAGEVRIAIGTHTLNSGTVLGSGFRHTGGTLAVAGTVGITGQPAFESIINGLGGQFTGAGTMRFTGSPGKFLQGTGTLGANVLFDSGTVFALNSDWTNSGTITLSGTGAWNDGVLRNTGTIRKTTSPNAVAIASSWNGGTRAVSNSGLIESLSGDLNLHGSGTHTNAQFRSSASGAVQFVEGQQDLTGPITSSGNVRIAGATLRVPSGAVLWTGPLGLTSGALNTIGDLDLDGPLQMSNGIKTGAGTLTVRQGALVTGGGFRGGLTVLQGESSGVTASPINTNGQVRNEGVLTLGNVNWYDGQYDNPGKIVKVGASMAVIAQPWSGGTRSFASSGTVETQSGELRIVVVPSNYDAGTRTLTGGTWIVRPSATFNIGSGPIDRSVATIILEGAVSNLFQSGGINALATFQDNVGSFRILSGRDFTRTGTFANSGDVTIGSGGSDFVATTQYQQTDGLTEVRGTLQSPAVNLTGGLLTGDGTVLGPITNGATVAPGVPGGVLTSQGTYTVASGATHRMRIRGLSATEYGSLSVAGNVNLNGALQAQNLGYAVSAGDTFRVISFTGSRTGTFATVPDPADWSVVYGAGFVDLVAVRDLGAPVNVQGNIRLQGWIASPTNQPITITLVQGGDVVETRTVFVDANGDYEFETRRFGEYTVLAKGPKWLRSARVEMLTPPFASGLDFDLLGGDCNGDNRCDIDDFLVLAAAYETAVGDAGYDPLGDLTGDEIVNLDDFLLLAANYEIEGD